MNHVRMLVLSVFAVVWAFADAGHAQGETAPPGITNREYDVHAFDGSNTKIGTLDVDDHPTKNGWKRAEYTTTGSNPQTFTIDIAPSGGGYIYSDPSPSTPPTIESGTMLWDANDERYEWSNTQGSASGYLN